MGIPDDFYTVSSLFTLTGSSTAVWIITSVVGDLLGSKLKKKAKKWLGLALSIAFMLLAAIFVSEKTVLTWVVALVNAFLVYLTAVGINSVTSQAKTRESGSPVKPTSGEGEGGFFEPWW